MADNNNFHGPIHAGMSVDEAKRAVAQVVRDVEQLGEDMLHAQERGTISEELCIYFDQRSADIETRIKACSMILGIKPAFDGQQTAEVGQASDSVQHSGAPRSPDDDDSSDETGSNQSPGSDDENIDDNDDNIDDDDDNETLIGSEYEDDYFQGYEDSNEGSVYSSEDGEDDGESPEELNEDEQSIGGMEDHTKDGEDDDDDDDNSVDSLASSESCSSHGTEEDEEFGYPLHRFQANSYNGASPHDEESSDEDEELQTPAQIWIAEQQLPSPNYVDYSYQAPTGGQSTSPQHNVDYNEPSTSTAHDAAPQHGERWVRGCCREHNQQDLEALGRTNIERMIQARASLPEAPHHVRYQTLERSELVNISEETENGMEKDEQDEEVDHNDWEDCNSGNDDNSDDNNSFDLDRPISPFELPPPLSPPSPPRATVYEYETEDEDAEEVDDEVGDEYGELNDGDGNNIWFVSTPNHPSPISIIAPESSTPPPPYTPTQETQPFPTQLTDNPLDPSHPLAAAISARIHSDAVHSAHLARIRSDADRIIHLEASNLIQRSIIQTLLPSDGAPAPLSEQTAEIMMQRIQDLEAELVAREQIINAQAHEITHLVERTDLQDDTIAIQEHHIKVISEENAILQSTNRSAY